MTSTVTLDAARSLAEQGMAALRSGDADRARGLLARAGPELNETVVWINLAIAERMLENADSEWQALHKALEREPRSLPALLMKGALLERRGETPEAAQTYGSALMVAPPFHQLPRELQGSVRHAYEVNKKWNESRADFLAAYLDKTLGKAVTQRFSQSVDVLSGRKSIYRQQPHHYFFPELPTIQFFDREDFPWLKGVEDATDKIRNEFLSVFRADEGFSPYVDYPSHAPVDEWAELNRSSRWNAFHLWKEGRRIEENCVRCPETMAVLDQAPSPVLQQRTPSAMFSVLKPKTRIPPHTGVTNCRLVVHVPLIVPENCGFRVGNETRQWRPGEALIFDDTIEHEAWNDSGEARAVLIFDIWNPLISEDEQAMVQALYRGMDEFGGFSGGSAVD